MLLLVCGRDLRPVLSKHNLQIFTYPEAAVAVGYAPDRARRAAKVYGLYLSVRNSVSTKLRLDLKLRPTIVDCAARNQFRRVFRACFGREVPAYAAAVAVPAAGAIFLDRSSLAPLRSTDLRGLLGHETAHLLLHHAYRWIPRWLDEGLAMWASGEKVNEAMLLSVRAWAARGGTIPFGELQNNFPRRHRPSAFAYVQSYCVTSYLIMRRGGITAVKRLLELCGTVRFRRAWLDVYGEPPEATWEAWRRWEARHFDLVTFLVYQLPAFTFPALLFLAAVVRLRLRRRRYFRQTEDEGDLPGGLPYVPSV